MKSVKSILVIGAICEYFYLLFCSDEVRLRFYSSFRNSLNLSSFISSLKSSKKEMKSYSGS